MLFNSWTRKLLLLQLSLLVVSFSTYTVGIVWKVHFTWRNGIHNETLSKPSTDDIFYTAEVWGLLICLSSMLYTETQAHPRSKSVFGAIYIFISTLSLVLGGDTITKSARDALSLMNQNDNESFDHITVTDPKVILKLTGNLVKGLSWLLFTVQTTAYTHNLDDINIQPSPTTTVIYQAQRILIVSLIYSLVILWTMIASWMDFKFAYHDYFILCYYLATVFTAGCIGDDSTVKRVILSIFSVPFMTVILLDFGKTIFCSRDRWIQQHTPLNPVHLSVKLSSVLAGLFLWIYKYEPLSGEPRLRTGKLYMQAKTTTL